jgi:hypothetical protein
VARPNSRPSIEVLIACARIGSAVTANPAAMQAATKPRRFDLHIGHQAVEMVVLQVPARIFHFPSGCWIR